MNRLMYKECRKSINAFVGWEEVPDLVKHLNAVRKVNLEGKEAE